MSDKTDEEIAAHVQQGDGESFGLLMERYQQKITRYARKFLFKNESDIEDIVQEAFIKAYTNIRGFDVKRRFSPWMYRIAHNEFINAAKKRGREKIAYLDLDTIFPQPVSPEMADAEVTRTEMRELLEQCLGQLAPKYREPLVLYYFEGMDYKELSDILQIPVSTVGVRLTRGKSIMKTLVTKIQHDHARE
ncbi:MAG: RNA polymerase sigma factor [Candidatus Komeilibacteria bacterium]|nr:RNA polymerase sigma factor [Candidatus Komeilibacteria bacterium]